MKRSSAPEEARRSEAGDTLIEVLLAIVILGIASVAILLAFATTISGSAEHRTLTTADTVLEDCRREVDRARATAAEYGLGPAAQLNSSVFLVAVQRDALLRATPNR